MQRALERYRDPRRQSFSADDVFFSPVEWSKSPRHDRDVDEIRRVLDKGDFMCRHSIDPAYIQHVVSNPDAALWMVRDAKQRIFGFAVTKQNASHLYLELICTHRRTNKSSGAKGDGMRLFGDILEYVRQAGTELRLSAVNGKVAVAYAREAIEAFVPQLAKQEMVAGRTPALWVL